MDEEADREHPERDDQCQGSHPEDQAQAEAEAERDLAPRGPASHPQRGKAVGQLADLLSEMVEPRPMGGLDGGAWALGAGLLALKRETLVLRHGQRDSRLGGRVHGRRAQGGRGGLGLPDPGEEGLLLQDDQRRRRDGRVLGFSRRLADSGRLGRQCGARLFGPGLPEGGELVLLLREVEADLIGHLDVCGGGRVFGPGVFRRGTRRGLVGSWALGGAGRGRLLDGRGELGGDRGGCGCRPHVGGCLRGWGGGLAHFGEVDIFGFGFDLEILHLGGRKGIRIVEVPVEWHNAPGSKVSPLRDSVRMCLDLVRIRVRHP